MITKEETLILAGVGVIAGAFLLLSKPSYGTPVITSVTLDSSGTLKIYGPGLTQVGIYIDGTSDLVLYSGDPIVINNVPQSAMNVYARNYLGVVSNTAGVQHI